MATMQTSPAGASTAMVRVPPELRDHLQQLARRNERSLAGECRIAMREHVERNMYQRSGDPARSTTSSSSR